jgi:predicted TIM-barrel fold metal-dependent hydrolase
VGTIIDTHTHFWDLTRNPGFSNGRTVLPDDYLKVARPAGITGTVVVEAVWRNLQENMWGLELAERNTIIVGVVGRLSVGSATFKDDLDALARSRFFRGLRVGASDLRNANIRLLGERGLSADVDAGSAANVRIVATEARALPTLRIVLDHAAGLNFASDPSGELATALQMAAEAPNVYCKVSRFQEQAGGQRPAPTDPAAYRRALDFLWRTFGEDRLIFGSNWPLSEAGGSLADAVKIMKDFFDAKGKDAAEKFFWRNAKTAYQWVPR